MLQGMAVSSSRVHVVSSSLSLSPTVKTGSLFFFTITDWSANVRLYIRLFPKSTSTALYSSANSSFVCSSSFVSMTCRKEVAELSMLPYAFFPPRAEVSATAAMVPLPWLGVNSQTNLYPSSSALLSVRFRLPLATFAVAFTSLPAYATGSFTVDG